MTTPVYSPADDLVDRIVGIQAGDALHAVRHQRDKVAVATQGSYDAVFDPALAGDAAMKVGFVFGDEPFVVQIEKGTITTRRGATDTADVVLTTQPPLVAACVYGKVPPAAFEADDLMTLTGDRAVFDRFAGFFNLPEKAPV